MQQAERRHPVEEHQMAEGMTYESIEYDTPAKKVRGRLETREVPALGYTQTWIDGVQVDPDTVELLDAS